MTTNALVRAGEAVPSVTHDPTVRRDNQGRRASLCLQRNPATGEEIRIKASKASKKVAFRVAKGLSEAI